MEIDGFHEINVLENVVRSKQHQIRVETVADFTSLDFLVTKVDTSRIDVNKFNKSMLHWPEVQAVQDAAEKLAKRILQEI